MIRFNEGKPPQHLRDMPEHLRFTAHGVERQSGETDVDFSSYYVLRLELAQGNHQAAKLKKPLQAVFPKARVCFMTIDKRQAYAVICYASLDVSAQFNELESACAALTGESVNIGVSMQSAGEAALPVAFRQADAALEKAFFQPEANIYLFYAETCADDTGDGDSAQQQQRQDQLGEAVCRGESEHCAALLEQLFHHQRSHLGPGEILREGQQILERCRDELEHADAAESARKDLADCRAKLKQCPTFAAYCALMSRSLEESSRAVADKLRTGGSAVLNARNYIEQNYHLPISLGEVAQAIGVNASYLSRSFKSKMGVNLVDSINRKKISVAQELLGQGRLKISEVSAAVGIEDTAYFSHLFRKYSGMSPRDYQKRRLHGAEVQEQR